MAEDNVVAKMQIAAKLNPEFDAELISQILEIPKRERSHVFRQALREYFQKREDGQNK
jgi:metal-responsive CopG/Arc/MetJ family transcriptional regulator